MHKIPSEFLTRRDFYIYTLFLNGIGWRTAVSFAQAKKSPATRGITIESKETGDTRIKKSKPDKYQFLSGLFFQYL